MLGSKRFLNCVFPSICYESKGWSSSKQSVLISSTFLLLMVTAAAAALRCSVYPKPLSNSVFLLPWVNDPDFADVQDNISILCWMLTRHEFVLNMIIYAQHFFHCWGIFVAPLLHVATAFTRGWFTDNCSGKTREINYQALYLAEWQLWGTWWLYLFCIVALKVICLQILMHYLEGVHLFLIFCHVKFHTVAKVALTK